VIRDHGHHIQEYSTLEAAGDRGDVTGDASISA
jgi:hypothetical protein